ncbi:MAG TPA: aminoacyl-tRNA hydrolase [Rhodothermales bacterium]
MAGAKKLIAGLGNPGSEYERTRHNVGFEAVDLLARRQSITLKQHRGIALVGWGMLEGNRIGVMKPITFMNLSGRAVRDVLQYYDVDPADLLVVCDDLNLPLGTIRIRTGGSAGGHNGIQNVIDVLKTDAFPRLRIGIGNEFARGRQADYVLSPFSSKDREVIDGAIQRATDAIEAFVREGVDAAMNRFN